MEEHNIKARGNEKNKPLFNENALNWSVGNVTSAQLLRIFGWRGYLNCKIFNGQKSCSSFPGRAKWIHYHNFFQASTTLSFDDSHTFLSPKQLWKAVKLIKAHRFNCDVSHVKRPKGFPTQIFIVHLMSSSLVINNENNPKSLRYYLESVKGEWEKEKKRRILRQRKLPFMSWAVVSEDCKEGWPSFW